MNDLRGSESFSKLVEGVLDQMGEETFEKVLENKINQEFPSQLEWLGYQKHQWLTQVTNEVEGWGPLEELLKHSGITEICVNSYLDIDYFIDGKKNKSTDKFCSDRTYNRLIQKILREIQKAADVRHPFADGTLNIHGQIVRVHLVLPPVALNATLTLRKHIVSEKDLSDLEQAKMFDKSVRMVLEGWLKEKLNIIICGPTDSGKTTLLRALLKCISAEERIVSLEDTYELGKLGPHHVSLLARHDPEAHIPNIELQDLLKNSLRMRPDRIIVGEIRGAEALILLDSLATGHQGSMGTLHAKSAAHALKRLESLALRGHPQMNLSVMRQTVCDSIQALIVCNKVKGQRRVTELALLKGAEDFGYLLEPVFLSDS